MEWLFIILGLIVWLIYRGSKARKPEERTQSRRAVSGVRSGRGDARRTGSQNFGKQGVEANPRAKGKSPARWVQPGESVVVGSFLVEGGLFYLGGLLPGQSAGSCGNCVLDPTEKVAASGEDRDGRTMPYWPSYQSIPPIARRTYLSWLAGGRDDPSIGIGYVFLYFYGIEHRMFADQAPHEAPVLVAEVRRLLAIYGGNGSFGGYASKFLDAAELVEGLEIRRPPLRANLRSGYEIPPSVRLYLGRKLAAKEPLDATDSLLWVLSLPDTSLRTPATRCFDELVELWGMRFSSRYPEGLKVNAPETHLGLDYRAASGGFECRIDVSGGTGPLPDIAAVPAPLDGLRDILNACTEELAPYSRFLGRNPGAKGTVEASFLLPRDLLASPAAMGGTLLARIGQLFGDRKVAGLHVSRLASALSLDIGTTGKVSTGLCNQIGAFFERMDIGMEPDRRYGSRNLKADGYVLLFKAQGGAKVDGDDPDYVAARARIDIAVLAATADGKVETAEYELIKSEIRAMPGLDGVERARLTAYAGVMLKDTPGQQSTLNKMKKLAQPAKKAVIRSATAAIMADGHSGPDEVKFLERLYRTLDMPVEEVRVTLHRGAVVIDEPVAVTREERVAGAPVPPPPVPPPPAPSSPASLAAAPAPSVKIDRARLERIRSETSAVSELLAGIFIEEPDETAAGPASRAVADAADARFPGLDPRHSRLLTLLLGGDGLDRDEFDEAAKGFRLLPDGAIETINDWGFDRFDESVIDDDERVTIPVHIRGSLMEAAAG